MQMKDFTLSEVWKGPNTGNFRSMSYFASMDVLLPEFLNTDFAKALHICT